MMYLGHSLHRCSSGAGLEDYTYSYCSCGWVGEKVYEWQDDMEAQLREQENIHLSFLATTMKIQIGPLDV